MLPLELTNDLTIKDLRKYGNIRKILNFKPIQ